MNPTTPRFPLLVVLVCATASIVNGQESVNPTVQLLSRGAIVVEGVKEDSSDVLEVLEDMEILRRLIDAAVKRQYGAGRAEESATETRRRNLFEPTQSMQGAGSPMGAANPFEVKVFSSTETTPEAVGDPLATYVRGYGVIYQLAAPPPAPERAASKPDFDQCPYMSLSAWERKQLEIRGGLARMDCTACHAKTTQTVDGLRLSIVDSGKGLTLRSQLPAYVELTSREESPTKNELVKALVDVLAENGHYVHLADDERVRIAVTFRQLQPTTPRLSTNSPFGAMSGYISSLSDYGEMMPSGPSPARVAPSATRGAESGYPQPPGGVPGAEAGEFGVEGYAGDYGGAYGPTPAGSVGDPGLKNAAKSVRDQVLTGDLLMRQGTYFKAAEAYEKAVREHFGGDPYQESGFPDGFRSREPDRRLLLEKLARALVGAGQYDKAQKLLGNLKQADAKAGEKTGDKPPTDTVTLPRQLIVSVTKADLDAVAAGEISREEFDKRVEISDLDPAAQLAKRTDEAAADRDDGPREWKGKIYWVDTTNKMVWIDLGALDRLKVRTVFRVYGPTDDRESKGEIEVTRILRAHIAEARILQEDEKRPIQRGDLVESQSPKR